MILCDIDCFKAINHRSGRITDNHVLVAVARELTGTIDGRQRIGPFGGEELVAFVADVIESDAAGVTETRRRRLHWHSWQQTARCISRKHTAANAFVPIRSETLICRRDRGALLGITQNTQRM